MGWSSGVDSLDFQIKAECCSSSYRFEVVFAKAKKISENLNSKYVVNEKQATSINLKLLQMDFGSVVKITYNHSNDPVNQPTNQPTD